MKVKEESEKFGLKLILQKTKIMVSSPIISWQIDGETVETGTNFIFLGSKITAGGDCSHKIKRHLLLGRKAMTNLDSVLKSRDITLPTKVHLVKAMVFPVVMYRCKSWTIKKAEHWRTDAFELWCWKRLLRVLWSARRQNQSILKEIIPEYSLEGLMLKLKFQHHSSKASVLWCSAFFMVQLSYPYVTTGKTIALTTWTFVSKVMSLLFNNSILKVYVVACARISVLFKAR